MRGGGAECVVAKNCGVSDEAEQGAKVLNLMERTGLGNTRLKLPGLEIAHDNMQASRAYAGECLDGSSMDGVLWLEAGLPFWNEKSCHWCYST